MVFLPSELMGARTDTRCRSWAVVTASRALCVAGSYHTVALRLRFCVAHDPVHPVLGVHEQLPPPELCSPLRRRQGPCLLLAGLRGLHAEINLPERLRKITIHREKRGRKSSWRPHKASQNTESNRKHDRALSARRAQRYDVSTLRVT